MVTEVWQNVLGMTTAQAACAQEQLRRIEHPPSTSNTHPKQVLHGFWSVQAQSFTLAQAVNPATLWWCTSHSQGAGVCTRLQDGVIVCQRDDQQLGQLCVATSLFLHLFLCRVRADMGCWGSALRSLGCAGWEWLTELRNLSTGSGVCIGLLGEVGLLGVKISWSLQGVSIDWCSCSSSLWPQWITAPTSRLFTDTGKHSGWFYSSVSCMKEAV